MRLEHDNREIGTHADDHQRHEHRVTAREFGNEEDTRQRGMHHTRHHASHAQQGEVLLGHIDTNLVDVPQTREEETRETADEQRRGKRTTATATAISGRGGHHLRKQHEGDIRQEHGALTGKEGVVEDAVPVGLRPSVEQQVDTGITFTIECREEEDEQTQRHTADGQFDVRMILELGKHAFAGTHHPDEIERYQTTADAQEDTGWDALHRPTAVKMEGKKGCITTEDIGEDCGCHTRDENRQKGRHRHIDHQHLKREHQSGYRGLKDTCNSTGCTTAHEGHKHLTVEMEQLSEVRADGRACEHDRSLSTHRSTETDGNG